MGLLVKVCVPPHVLEVVVPKARENTAPEVPIIEGEFVTERGYVPVREDVATFAKVFTPEKYGMLPITAAVEVESPPNEIAGVDPFEEIIGQVPVTAVIVPPPPPTHVPFTAKQPAERLMPLAAVELAEVPDRFKYVALIPAPKVEVAEPNMLVAPLLPTHSPFVADESVDEAFPKVERLVTVRVPPVKISVLIVVAAVAATALKVSPTAIVRT